MSAESSEKNVGQEPEKKRPWHEVACDLLLGKSAIDLDILFLGGDDPRAEAWSRVATIAVAIAQTKIPADSIGAVIDALIETAQQWTDENGDADDNEVIQAIAEAIRAHDGVAKVQDSIDDGWERLQALANELGLEIPDEEEDEDEDDDD